MRRSILRSSRLLRLATRSRLRLRNPSSNGLDKIGVRVPRITRTRSKSWTILEHSSRQLKKLAKRQKIISNKSGKEQR